jgi:hypothetical protein
MNEENNKIEIFCRYVTRGGKKIYPKGSKFFHFWVTEKSKKN